MLTNEQMDELVQPIVNLYNQIELELIIEIAKRFDTYDEIGGSLEWQLKKLQEMGTLNADMIKIISKYSAKSTEEIKDMLKASCFANIDLSTLDTAFNAGAIKVDLSTIKDGSAFAQLIDSAYRELSGTFRLIQTKALESATHGYIDVINRSFVEVSAGTYDYGTAIKRAVERMATRGFTGATYRRGGKTVNYSIEATVRRDTLTAAHKLSNKVSEKVCEDLDAEYVEISSHLGARVHPTNPIANHAGWQGKVFKIHGSDEYPNLKESTGYPDDILGLSGVNCRHRMFPFFPGISEPNPIRFSEEENKKAYELSQQQRKHEREMRKLKKAQAAAKAIGDTENVKKLNKQILEKSNEIDAFCEANNLKRDHSRELVTEQITKNVDSKNESGIITSDEKEVVESTVHYIGKIDKDIYSCVTNDIQSEDVIITDRQIEHIMERHPKNYEMYHDFIKQIIEKPDYILEANKPDTAFVLKHIEENGINYELILRLRTSKDPKDYKNSVITFLKVEEKRYQRYLRTKKILYKSE